MKKSPLHVILVTFVIMTGLYSCTKEQQVPLLPGLTRIKTTGSFNGQIDETYFYHADGRLNKIIKAASVDEYFYADSAITVMQNSAQLTRVLGIYRLKGKLAWFSWESSPVLREIDRLFDYYPSGHVRTQLDSIKAGGVFVKFMYFYSSQNLDSMWTISGSNAHTHTTTYTYFTNRKNTIGEESFGRPFFGKSSANPIRRSVERNLISNRSLVHDYTYQFDNKGRITQMTRTPTEGLAEFKTFTYY